MEVSQCYVILLSLLGLAITVTTEAQTHLSSRCSSTATFAPNSTYQANLNILLSALSSNGTNSTGFYTSFAGQDPDDVYGFYLCRRDLSTDVCQQCVTTAAQNVVQRCPLQKVAIIWYDKCLLRYSNRSVSPVLDMEDTFLHLNTENITVNQQQFVELLNNTLSETTEEAAAGTFLRGEKFAVKDVNYTSSSVQRLYTLAQCRPDLSTFACNQCFQAVTAQICVPRQGAQVSNPSCSARFEIYAFYNLSVVPIPPPPPPPTPPPPVIRLPPPPTSGNNRITIIVIAIVVPICVSIMLFGMVYCFLRRRAKKNYDFMEGDNAGNDITTESLQFDLSTIETATQNFANANKLGEGGFSAVYKGTLPNGQEIAVKKLSKKSGEGAEEFKNEVILVTKLQHKNLVRLLGFCLQGGEKILVYEFVPNKSLDYFLVDPEKQAHLDWSRRYNIIRGIARGILYLHQGSRFRIIHRDLKTSNILLDADMNPKISDFGISKVFGVDQTHGNTNRIVGTHGYMSPEYLIHGQFSVKSDAYSFGVLVLEIVCGKKNSGFHQIANAEDVISNVWKQWRDGTPLNMVDPILGDGYSRNEVMRCIHIGLLCVQEDPTDRPTMETIVLMLDSYTITLPLPKQPAFFSVAN